MGGEVTIHEMVATLWAGTGDQGLGYRTTIKALADTLKDADAEDLLYRKRSVLSVDSAEFDCDLYDFRGGQARGRQRLPRRIYAAIPMGPRPSPNSSAPKRRG